MKLDRDDAHKAMREGVDSAFWAWLIEHEVTAPEHFEDGVKEAVTKWLDNHGETIFASIVRDAVREWLDGLAPAAVNLTGQQEEQ